MKKREEQVRRSSRDRILLFPLGSPNLYELGFEIVRVFFEKRGSKNTRTYRTGPEMREAPEFGAHVLRDVTEGLREIRNDTSSSIKIRTAGGYEG
jgi:hypothetical protein